MSVSARGIARRFLGQGGALSVREVFFGGTAGVVNLRERLETLARKDFSFDFSECVYGWTVNYQQTWSHVRVRIQLNPDAGISAATLATLRTAWENGIENRWSKRWGIGHPGEITCPLTFDVQWVTTDAHYVVRVRTGPARSNMRLWDTSDTGNVAAHEFGHMLGNADEYTDPACPSRNPVNTGTVMDNNSNNVPPRLMQRLADGAGSNVVSLSA
jgi:hypothetical protein